MVFKSFEEDNNNKDILNKLGRELIEDIRQEAQKEALSRGVSEEDVLSYYLKIRIDGNA